MESVDMKKLETAIIYLNRIADGNNPVNNLPAEEESVLNDPNVIRCMFFVKEVLEEVKRNNGFIGRKPRRNALEEFPLQALASYTYHEDKAITRFVDQINEAVDTSVYKKLSYKSITQWLKAMGYLFEEYNQQLNKKTTLPTEKGMQIGIKAERRHNQRGDDYIVVIYNKQAQDFVIKNMESILKGEAV